MTRVRVAIDEERCIGSGQCVMAMPELFDQRDEDGIAIVLNENPPEPLTEAVRTAARLCPSQAITLVEI